MFIVELCVYLVKAENSDGYLILFNAVSFSCSVSRIRIIINLLASAHT